MNDKKLEELHQYFTGYGSPHDELIIRLIKEYRLSIEEIYQHLEDKEELEKQNKRYREALEFYADKGTYEVAETLPPTDEYQQPIEPVFKTVPIIYYDKGKEAREALEGEE